jgi:putative intracellular protease/amidase/YHS domain-containing protein
MLSVGETSLPYAKARALAQYSGERNKMNRRNLLKSSAALGFASAIPALTAAELLAGPGAGQTKNENIQPMPTAGRLTPPADGKIPVAFPISDGAVIIDFCGPWEVFQDAGFQVYTVGETLKPIRASGGMQIIPNYTFETAPAPKVIVIPAQSGATKAMTDWIRTSTKNTDVTMSVCTGAFVLARTGLLSGKSATTFHVAFDKFEAAFPDVKLIRGARFVENGNLATSGGLSSGIDLAIRVVERYFDRATAEKLAFALEYQGKGWMDANSNQGYANFVSAMKPDKSQPICPVCGMAADQSISSVYKGRTYYFCESDHKQEFDGSPDNFVKAT